MKVFVFKRLQRPPEEKKVGSGIKEYHLKGREKQDS
jgi:hypothetical protein